MEDFQSKKLMAEAPEDVLKTIGILCTFAEQFQFAKRAKNDSLWQEVQDAFVDFLDPDWSQDCWQYYETLDKIEDYLPSRYIALYEASRMFFKLPNEFIFEINPSYCVFLDKWPCFYHMDEIDEQFFEKLVAEELEYLEEVELDCIDLYDRF
ncbi:MAG: hypothetical protein WCK11_00570 [Candidatus Falkowbacteria bacterium]